MIARWRRLRKAGQSGQALVEQGVLLATLLGGLAVGGVWLMKTHPDMMNAINIAMAANINTRRSCRAEIRCSQIAAVPSPASTLTAKVNSKKCRAGARNPLMIGIW